MKNRFLMILALLFVGLFLSGGFLAGKVMADVVGAYVDSGGISSDIDEPRGGYMFVATPGDTGTSTNVSGYYINAYFAGEVTQDPGANLFSIDYTYDPATFSYTFGNAATLGLDSGSNAYLSYWDSINRIENGLLADATGVSVGSIDYNSGIHYGLTVDRSGSFIDGPFFV
ncbi:MAG TPA: hypothetical protein PLV15_03040, partial [Smithella sp.]|nr:hypothetical protein [Smithella sp.]